MVLILISLMVFPTRIILNTIREDYSIEISIFLKAQLIVKNQNAFLKIKVLSIPLKSIDLNKRKKKEVIINDSTNISKDKKRSISSMKIIPQFFRVITIQKMDVEFDTGDFPLNAQLIPLVQLANGNNIHIQVNFEDRNYFDMIVFTRLYKFIWILLSNKFTTNK